MTLYITLFFTALRTDITLSVYTFGTGGKHKHVFQDIYFSVEDTGGVGVLYTKTGEYSVVLEIENPIQKYSVDTDSYYDFMYLSSTLAQTLGGGYILRKQDIFVRKQFAKKPEHNQEFLPASRLRYFSGCPYTDSLCYLIITQETEKSHLFSYDSKKWRDFLVKIYKVRDLLHDNGVQVRFLNRAEASEHVGHYSTTGFKDHTVLMTSVKADDKMVSVGDKRCKVCDLVGVDCAVFPSLIYPYANIEVNNTEMPVGLVSVVDNVPDAEMVVYNQIIFLSGWKCEPVLLDEKKSRHASVLNLNNQMIIESIKQVQDIIARKSKLLVYTHFNMMVGAPTDTDLQKCTNHSGNAFRRMDIYINERAHSQPELFVSSLLGNCYSLDREYDRFLTLSDVAVCLMYEERVQHSEETPIEIYYIDHQDVPVVTDIAGKEGKNKLTDNSNFLYLRPSGSGKSFYMDSVVRQLHEQGTNVVMVDTDNLYEGLCEYFGGRYIDYTEEWPIAMNPFRTNQEEMNVEKTGFLKNLVLLTWKGTQGTVTETEDRLIEHVITEYYGAYFDGFEGFTPQQREDLRKSLVIDDCNSSKKRHGNERERAVRIEGIIDEIEGRRRELKVEGLSFNSFYEYSVQRIPDIYEENRITGIDLSTYRYMMKDSYLNDNHEKMLDENADSPLFNETFMVFEIDSIKDDPLLFPLITLIIMDAFLQKIRIEKNRRVPITEEAWKVTASPLMAEYTRFTYKTACKFRANVGVVAQETQGIIGSETVEEAIINNSDVAMLLDQNKFKEHFDTTKTILDLIDVDCKKIFTISRLENKEGCNFFREVFIRRDATSGAYGVEKPCERYMTYATERAEKETLKLYKRELQCSRQEAIKACCRD